MEVLALNWQIDIRKLARTHLGYTHPTVEDCNSNRAFCEPVRFLRLLAAYFPGYSAGAREFHAIPSLYMQV